MPLNPRIIARNTLCSLVIFIQAVAFPSLSLAQEAGSETKSSETASAASEETPQGASNTGPSSPTGADADTYVDNGDGTWSNGQYTWDSNTKQTKPNTPQDYSYNPATGRWDTKDWVYRPETGRYEANIVSTTSNPQAAQATQSGEGASIAGTGPNSNNTTALDGDSNGTFDLFFNGAISNSLSSTATTGDALVQGNTAGGSALTGDAEAIANILNLLQSSWLGQGSEVATFINNIDGNVYGDLVIDPAQLPYNLAVADSDVDVNITSNGVIDNDIDLVATTGNATVDSNTLGGDATSGDARAMANVINMINSAIKAGQSFIGMVNINGTLDGDILLPPGVLEALIASTGPNSNNTIGGNTASDVDIESNATRTINNNVETAATTGDANINSNTNAGNGTTGQAETGINTMNLIGQNIAGKNGLLVFVNVLGKWIGMVVSPSGATIANTGPGSNNTVGGGGDHSLSANATENSLINNDISVAAHSGDASVTNNTTGGSATSGNAQASVNLLNMIGSNVEMTDWFGVLFINVFGNWFGNFGSDTANGGFSQTPPPASGGGGETAAPASSGGSNPVGQVFGFVARNVGGQTTGTATNNAEVNGGTATDNQDQVVFGAATPNGPAGASSATSAPSAGSNINWWLIVGGIGILGTITILGREYVLALREERLA